MYGLLSERWVDVAGYEWRYQVSDLGRIKSLPNSRRASELIMKQSTHIKSGHMIVRLTSHSGEGWVQKDHYVHRLVLDGFAGSAPEGMECCHNDGNPGNNNNQISNLRWDTRKANQLDRAVHGTANYGEQNPQSVLTKQKVARIKARLGKTPQSSLAKEFGVSRSAISGISTGRLWKDVDAEAGA